MAPPSSPQHPLPDLLLGPGSSEGRRGALRLSVGLALAVFAADLILESRPAIGGLYLLPVLLSLWARSNRATQIAAGLCIALGGIAKLSADTPKEPTFVTEFSAWLMEVFAIGVTAYLGLIRKGIEDELHERRETMATTLASIADGVITTDVDGRVTFINRAAEQVLEWTREEAVGRDAAAVFRRLSEVRGTAEPAEANAPSNAEETVIVLRDGQHLTVEVSSSPIRDLHSGDGVTTGRVYVFRDISERKAEQERVEELAYRDALTGLANRASFFDRFELELTHTKRRGGVLGLLYLDLDGFKDVNDLHGHDIGDRLLVQLGERMTESLRAGDTIARLGGDEFTVVLPDVSSKESARGVVDKLLRHLAEPYEIDDLQLNVPPSIGLALYPEDGEDMTTLLRAADNSMYRAKGSGGACWSTSDEIQPAPRREPPQANESGERRRRAQPKQDRSQTKR